MNQNYINYFIWFLMLCFIYIIIWNIIPTYEGLTATAAPPPSVNDPAMNDPTVKAAQDSVIAATKAAQDSATAAAIALNLANQAALQAKSTNAQYDIDAAVAAQQSADAAAESQKSADNYAKANNMLVQSLKDSINFKPTLDDAIAKNISAGKALADATAALSKLAPG